MSPAPVGDAGHSGAGPDDERRRRAVGSWPASPGAGSAEPLLLVDPAPVEPSGGSSASTGSPWPRPCSRTPRRASTGNARSVLESADVDARLLALVALVRPHRTASACGRSLRAAGRGAGGPPPPGGSSSTPWAGSRSRPTGRPPSAWWPGSTLSWPPSPRTSWRSPGTAPRLPRSRSTRPGPLCCCRGGLPRDRRRADRAVVRVHVVVGSGRHVHRCGHGGRGPSPGELIVRITRAVVVALLAALCTALPLDHGAGSRRHRAAAARPPVAGHPRGRRVRRLGRPSPGAGQTPPPGVGYGTARTTSRCPPVTYAISMRQAGADPASPPVLSTTVEVDAGQARTVAGVGPFAGLGLEVLEDDLDPAGARHRPRARGWPRRHRPSSWGWPSPTARPWAATWRSPTPATTSVPAGASTLQVTPAGGQPVSLPVDVAGGSVYSVLVLDSPDGGLTVRPTLDAAGTGAVPAGASRPGPEAPRPRRRCR